MSDKVRKQDEQSQTNEEQREPLLTNDPRPRSSSTESESSIPYTDRLNDTNTSSTISRASSTNGNASREQLPEGNTKHVPLVVHRLDVQVPIVIEVHEKDNRHETDRTEPTQFQSSERSASGAESPEILANVEPAGRNLRRNSISLPMGIDAVDLEALRLKYQMQDQDALSEEEKSDSHGESINEDSCGSTTLTVPERSISSINQKDEESDDEECSSSYRKYRDPFRSRRRASIAPLPALRLNSKEMIASDFDTHSLASNQASITSINSLASLLREKMNAFPQMIRKKKRETKDYKIKIFVTILFFIIVFLIGYAYITYHREILTRSYFEKIKFSSLDRTFSILSHEDKEMIKGKLGISIGSDSIPFYCLEDQRKNDGSVCLEWNGIARLYMSFQNMNVFRCYNIQWQALGSGIYPTDCYELKRDNGLWFGGGFTKGMEWSLSSANFDYAPFGSGDAKVHQFGNGVKRYFINSIGVAMQVDDHTPLHISVNQTENRFCLRARNDNFTFVNHLTEYPELSYKICTTEDMRSLHMLMTQQSLWDGLKESDIYTLHTLIEEPVWKIPFQSEVASINETTIYNYSEDVIAMGFMRLGHILVNEFWQKNIGDFIVDQERFPTLKDTIEVLHRRGFKVVFTIQPFISTDSPNFKDAVKNKLLIYERHSERSIPALTRYKSSSSAGVLDITNNASIPWLRERLEKLKEDYQVDSFYLDLGTGYNLPHYYQCRMTLNNPDMYSKIFTSSMESVGFIGVSSASVVPKPPAFLSTPPINSSWEGLRELLTIVLNYGVNGYPFVLPGAIGGDYYVNRTLKKMVSFYSLGQPELAEQNLFLRWMQLMTFMPSMQFSHLPSEYKSDYITDHAKELMAIRQKIVIPILKKYLSESMNEGLPLVRPLWMLDPHDPACLVVNDEFSVGEELIVAPILENNSEEREVYLPQGVWKDGIDGSLRKGSRWMHNYKVTKDKIAHFIKMPDNTRF
ncbi:myogenesis-regulating glycosidase isoform X1 [Anastrepha ludens]|uniref:myogenesis-regulating glycosidase isoform X1 n=2 Tax=Anastrepha ludens TaxID=28586 RepID=UPI0023B0C204|nr:myogenesis-regulating glycosidase isoform X1 [Anastrepha ludens]XP_053948172.1 myogenesis-regulating glycosidase isoform X1 [Anastrepha ludens]XP_053948173.1 myogenesis-regulating glycosidase isoform X1 [Anastrepha ludens]XP_053948174.1 myogenesis-regulating glycosidase isoform X1 [Anastrepha ludens]XP_053948175.1 myogenesis-regulating glycosidase isoform X1 [Anastrepha ludens]XP_053948176.1 myogenesis-regulating glycosidase isoform X1 [Anastrepha ludens]XP_053948177.1 myogenesis-regulatin